MRGPVIEGAVVGALVGATTIYLISLFVNLFGCMLSPCHGFSLLLPRQDALVWMGIAAASGAVVVAVAVVVVDFLIGREILSD